MTPPGNIFTVYTDIRRRSYGHDVSTPGNKKSILTGNFYRRLELLVANTGSVTILSHEKGVEQS